MTPEPGTLVRCLLQECHHYDDLEFELPRDFSCPRAGRCPVLYPPKPPAIWRRRRFQVCALAVICLAVAGAVFLRNETAVAGRKPRIIALSSPQDTLAGESWQAFVEAQGQPPLSYQWYRGYRGDTSIPISNANAPRYQTILRHENSVFWVRVTNSYGSVDSANVTVNTLPVLDYDRELFELFNNTRTLLEQSDSIRVLEGQLHGSFTGLTPEQTQRFGNLRMLAGRKQASAAEEFVKKLAYLQQLNKRTVSQKLQEAQMKTFPGVEDERRKKVLSMILEHWDLFLQGHVPSEPEVIANSQHYLPL